MADKRYYYLKLNENFFDEETIQWLEEQENGVLYSNFYLKLCLKSLKFDGTLIRLVGETLIPYDVKGLSKLTGVHQDTVRVAMELFKRIGLVKILETGEIYMAARFSKQDIRTTYQELTRNQKLQESSQGTNRGSQTITK